MNLKKILVPILLLTMMGVAISPTKASAWTDVSVVQAKSMIGSNPSLVILDVRNQSEYDAGHIGNAKLIPLYQLTGRLNELNKTNHILVYCKAGGRSLTASQILTNNSFLNIYNMLGGFTLWVTAGYPYFVKYPSIQTAINNATKGATIRVSSGNYTEHIIINKTINLVGENEYKTIIDGSGNGTIFKVEADNVSISNLTSQFCGCSCNGYSGISVLPNHRNVTITNNRFFSDGDGINITSAREINIIGNNSTYCDTAILLQNSSNILVSANYLAFAGWGINLINSAHNNFSQNTIFNDTLGLYLNRSDSNSIVANRFVYNQIEGIRGVGQSRNNSIYHNTFDSNAFALSSDAPNSLDNGYPSGGNYWSDYSGVDQKSGPNQNQTGSDGIGDTAYVIDANNTDHYPLMTQYPNIPEFPQLVVILPFMIATILAVSTYIRKQKTKLHPHNS
jgi:parallel beta-helix repeat protein